MNNFKDAVREVQVSAARQEWAALEKVLHDASAERAARLAAANLLASAGPKGQARLLRAVRFGDERTQATAFKAYLQNQKVLDEDLVLEVTQSSNRLLRRTTLGELKHLPYLVSDTFRLRCYLPTPFRECVTPDIHIAKWLAGDDWARAVVIRAITEARYRPAIPLLVDAMTTIYGSFECARGLILFGVVAVPALCNALPESDEDKRDAIVFALETIGGAEAEAALRTYAPNTREAPQEVPTPLVQILTQPQTEQNPLKRILARMWNRKHDQ